MKVIKFNLYGDFAHFCRAENNAFMASYAVPPRTVLLGIVGAILGLDKDTPQVLLEKAQFAVVGDVPQSIYHTTNLIKKNLPTINDIIKRISLESKGKAGPYQPFSTQAKMEWLVDPYYTVYASLPEPYYTEFKDRLINEQYHYSPCLGSAGMFAKLTFEKEVEIERLPTGTYNMASVVRESDSTFLKLPDEPIAFKSELMPRIVSNERVFKQPEPYRMPRDGGTLPYQTNRAWGVQDSETPTNIAFL